MNSSQPAPPPPPVAKVDMYTQRFSADCMRAKALFDRKGVTYNEYIIDHDDENREVMLKRSGGRSSVPQIFINGRDIGGTQQLEALEVAGQLDILLGEKPRNFHAEDAARAQSETTARTQATPGGIRGLLPRFRRP